MDSLKWRSWARTVAYVNLILSSMALLVIILLTVFLGLFISEIQSNPEDWLLFDPSKSDWDFATAIITATFINGTTTFGNQSGDFSSSEESGSSSSSSEEEESTSNPSSVSHEIDPAMGKAIAWMLWAYVSIMAILTLIQLWAAITLINGTDIGRTSNDALKMATTWRNVTVALMVCELFICLFLEANYLSLAISSGIQALFLLIVYKFMEELKYQPTAPTPPYFMEVTVKK